MWLRYLELFANAVPPDVVRTRKQNFDVVPRLTQHAIARIAQKLTHGTSLVAVIDGENANIPVAIFFHLLALADTANAILKAVHFGVVV